MFDSVILAEVGTFLDLLKTTVTITQLATHSVGAKCEESAGRDVAQAYQADFQQLVSESHAYSHPG